MRKRARLEIDIQRDIEEALGAERDLLIIRNSVGVARHFDDAKMTEYFVPYGLGKGSPDLVGILAPAGWWLCLEVKCPGERATDEQEKCHAIWRRFGALVDVVHSVDEARAALERAREMRRDA